MMVLIWCCDPNVYINLYLQSKGVTGGDEGCNLMSFSAFSRARDNASIRFSLVLQEGDIRPKTSWRLLTTTSAAAECGWQVTSIHEVNKSDKQACIANMYWHDYNLSGSWMHVGIDITHTNKSNKQSCTYSVAVLLAAPLASSNSQSETEKNPESKSWASTDCPASHHASRHEKALKQPLFS